MTITSAEANAYSLEEKLSRLQSYFRQKGSAVVCYSGGVDSAFVLQIAHQVLGPRAIGLTAVSPSLAQSEKEIAIRIASQIGARHELVETHEIDDPNYASNPSNRCYYCKTELYTVAKQWANRFGILTIVNGINTDDLGDYRPGIQAASEHLVESPLVIAGMNKEDVRQAAKLCGLGVWDKPASACLSSRIPYGSSVNREKLAQIEGFERELRNLGFKQLRVRWHDKIARIELAREEMLRALEPNTNESIILLGKSFGFLYITLDLQGYRQGSHNELLKGNSLRVLT